MWEDKPFVLKFDENVVTVNFEQLAAEGADLFILNGLTSGADVVLKESPVFRPLLLKAKATGRLTAIRLKHNAGVDADSYSGYHTQMDRISRIISGYKPDGLVLDCQQAQWTEGIKTVTCTPTNLALSIRLELDRAWKMCQLPPTLYTGTWFVRLYSPSDLTVYLDNLNKFEKLIPAMLAYWKFTNFPITNLADVRALVSIPTAAEEESKLNIGSYTKASAWEIGSVLHPAVLDANGKQTPFQIMLWMGTRAELYEAYNRSVPGTTVPVPDVPPVSGTLDLGPIEVILKTISEDLGAIRADIHGIRGFFRE